MKPRTGQGEVYDKGYTFEQENCFAGRNKFVSPRFKLLEACWWVVLLLLVSIIAVVILVTEVWCT